MSLQSVRRLTHIFTAEYAKRINAQVVHPAHSVVVKPNELESALSRPVHVATYEPHQKPSYLAATLAYGIMKGHPFQDGNKRTAFFLANEYIRSLGLPGLGENETTGKEPEDLVVVVAQRHIDVAAGKLDVDGLAYHGRTTL